MDRSQNLSNSQANQSMSRHSQSTGLTDEQGAREVAAKLMGMYDRNRDRTIDRTESVPMLVDVYRHFNRQFNPNSQDIDSFYKVLDQDNDQKITL